MSIVVRIKQNRGSLRSLLALTVVSALAACQPKPAPEAPAPVVQPQYTPRAPTPPLSASPTTVIPPLRPDGLRQTINRDIGPLQTLWHVRSALNVAALSCSGPTYTRIADDYNVFIKNNASTLKSAYNAIQSKFQREHGSGGKTIFDRHQTQLYNYWSFSPIRRPFCDEAMQVGQTAVVTKSADLNNFAAGAILKLEVPFNDFYLAFEQYQRDLAAWNQQYGTAVASGGQ